jgi:hypothetical protein
VSRYAVNIFLFCESSLIIIYLNVLFMLKVLLGSQMLYLQWACYASMWKLGTLGSQLSNIGGFSCSEPGMLVCEKVGSKLLDMSAMLVYEEVACKLVFILNSMYRDVCSQCQTPCRQGACRHRHDKLAPPSFSRAHRHRHTKVPPRSRSSWLLHLFSNIVQKLGVGKNLFSVCLFSACAKLICLLFYEFYWTETRREE